LIIVSVLIYSGEMLVVHGGEPITGDICLLLWVVNNDGQELFPFDIVVYMRFTTVCIETLRCSELAPPLIGVAPTNVHKFL
jgi:hypothetical protein